jgi:hypothetical protein
VDANDDGRTDPNNIFDAASGAGVYLCNGGVDLTEPGQLARAVRRYNHTDEYVRVVLELASAYDSGEIEPSPGVDPATLGETPMDPVIFDDFESVDPAPVRYSAPYAPPAPALAPAPASPPGPPTPAPGAAPTAPGPAPTTTAPPAPTTTTPSTPTTRPSPTTTPPTPTTRPSPTTTPSTPTTRPSPTTTPPTPTTRPGPATTTPSTPTTAPGGPTTTVPGGPPTTVPADPGTTVPGDGGTTTSTVSPAGDTSSSTPPASVGWSPTMLDFVTTTVAERAAECSAPGSSPVPTQPSVPASNPPCPAATPPEEQG